MSNNSNDNTDVWGCLSLIVVVFFICVNGGFWWVFGVFMCIFSAVNIFSIIDEKVGISSSLFGVVLSSFVVFIGPFIIAYFIYINKWAWTVYAVGGLYVFWGLTSLVESSQLPQKAKRLGRISQEISEKCKYKNWK
jgi:hypothetical protein